MSEPSFRRDWISKPIFRWARRVLPTLSDTEREAIEAGDVWWDADLFAGNPDWAKLLAVPPAKLSADEQAFLDGPVDELCRMLDDWQITWDLRDLPPEVWDFLKREKFFAMIIPKAYGGLGFSAYAHSEVIRKLSTRSLPGAVTAMVPNSLGPGRAAPAVRHQGAAGLLAAAARRRPRDSPLRIDQPGGGLGCRGDDRFRRGLPRHLAGHARCSASGSTGTSATSRSAPVATVIGPCLQALRSRAPHRRARGHRHHGGAGADRPARRRDRPPPSAGAADVPERPDLRPRRLHADRQRHRRRRAGRPGLEDAHERARGRARHLAAFAVRAGAAVVAHTTGAYARIREQFHVPIGRFQAIQERLGRMAATAYLLDAARRLTCAGIDAGHKPAVMTAIMKEQATERLRVVVNDAIDVHGGKGVQEGPHNYLGSVVPLGPDRHHGRRRQYRHPQPDPVRPRRDPQPSLPAQGDGGAGGSRPRARARRVRPRVLGACGRTASPPRRAPGAAPGPAASSRRRRRRERRAASTGSSGATPRPSRFRSTWRC